MEFVRWESVMGRLGRVVVQYNRVAIDIPKSRMLGYLMEADKR